MNRDLELLIAFLAPIQALLLDDSVTEIMGKTRTEAGGTGRAGRMHPRRGGDLRCEKPQYQSGGDCQSTRQETRQQPPTDECAVAGRQPPRGCPASGREAVPLTHHSEVRYSPVHRLAILSGGARCQLQLLNF